MRNVILLLLLAPQAALASDLDQRVRGAAAVHAGASLAGWRFVRIIVENGVETREACTGTGRREARCELVAVDGREPRDKERRKYLKNVAQPVTNNLPNIDLANLIDLASAAPAENPGNTATFTYRAATDEGVRWEDEGSMVGEATFADNGAFLRELNSRTTIVFKPAPGVKVTTMGVGVRFEKIEDQVFAVELSMTAEGKAFGLKRINQSSRYAFQDFVHVDSP